MGKQLLSLASLSGLLAVALGAFGAHGLQGKLSERMLEAYQTAVQYQFIHTLALLAVALLILKYESRRSLIIAACGFLAGIIMFSGSLYLLALGAPRWMGPVTPLGGLSFMVGWGSLFWFAWRLSDSCNTK